MTTQSTWQALRHLEQSTFLDKILDDYEVSGYSSDEKY
jgi:hypothetical protein